MKEEGASPTISTEGMFLTAVIDGMENKEEAIVDVPGAFMQAKMDETVHMQIPRAMVNMLLEIDKKKYGPCITIDGKQKRQYT